jgi:phosphatidylcholine synthase
MSAEPRQAEPRNGNTLKTALGFGVHIFTATGAALGLLALLAASRADWPLMFMLLGVALVVDGVDGALARRLDVAERLPRWSGETLDLVVDFVTYVLVPAYALAVGGLLPQGLAVPLGIAIVITGALYFADRRMKTTDNYFRGFPGVWNVPAFYLFLLRPDPWIAAAAIALLAVLTFVPVPFLHPFRVVRLRALNIALLAAWSVLAFIAVIRDMMPGPWITGALCVIALYFLGAGVLRRA